MRARDHKLAAGRGLCLDRMDECLHQTHSIIIIIIMINNNFNKIIVVVAIIALMIDNAHSFIKKR